MDARIARLRQEAARGEEWRVWMRRIALFGAILISGGLLSIPRAPLLALVLLICFGLKNPLRMFSIEFAGVWVLLITTAAIALLGGEAFQLSELAIRYGNFIAGIALLMVYIDERPTRIADDLYPILKLMAYQSVLTPIFALIVPGLFWTFDVQGTPYHTLGYIFTYHEFIIDATFFKRPDGFFFEPGVFQLYLNAFLFIALFLRRFSIFDIGLGAVSVIATQSTTGAAILVIQFCAVYLRWLKTSDHVNRIGLLILAPALLVPIAGYTAYNAAEKFYGQFSGSAEARTYDLRTGVNVVLEAPLTGIGFDYETYFDVASRVGYRDVRLSKENMFERPNSNGVITVFYTIGIPLGLIFLLGVLRQRFFRPRWLFATLLLLSLTAEALFFTPFVLMFAFSGLLIKPRRQARRALRNPRERARAGRQYSVG